MGHEPTVKMIPVPTCSDCGMALGEGMKFCIGCGKATPMAEREQPEITGPEKDHASKLPDTIIERVVIPPIPLSPQPDTVCRRCSATVRAGLKFCERCGAPTSPQNTVPPPNRDRKAAFLAAGAVFALVFLVGGWYLWGVSVTVVSNQPGVQVFIDDKLVSSSSSSQRITINHVIRGQRMLRVKREGFEDAVSTLKLGLGDFSKVVDITLRPYLYSLTIRSTPTECKVLVDGKEAGSTDISGDLTLKNISQGSHAVTVQHTGYQDSTQNITLTSTQTVAITLPLAVSGSWQGSFVLPASSTPSVFALNITQTGSSITGKADHRENNNMESSASLEGSVSGREIKYVKHYTTGGTAEYKGTVDSSGIRASGTWTSGAAAGTWVMAKVEKADSGWIAPIYSKIDSFNAEVTDLKFYESGAESPAQKKYNTRFSGSSSRSIYYDLFLKYPAPGRRVEFETSAVYYNSDGTVLGKKTRQASVDGSWSGSDHYDGWGSNTAGAWKTGFYRVDIFVAGKRIASKWFEMY